MAIFYHIHRSTKSSTLENGLIEEHALFFSKKNSFWFNIEKQIGIENFGGYIIYKINIPDNCFTQSFHKNAKYKILKLTKKNINKYLQFVNKLKGKNLLTGSIRLIDELKKRNYIGVDATSLNMTYNKSPHHLEGFIWNFTKCKIKIKKIKTVKK